MFCELIKVFIEFLKKRLHNKVNIAVIIPKSKNHQFIVWPQENYMFHLFSWPIDMQSICIDLQTEREIVLHKFTNAQDLNTSFR